MCYTHCCPRLAYGYCHGAVLDARKVTFSSKCVHSKCLSHLTRSFIGAVFCILADGFRSLAEGEDVEFEVTEDQNGRLRAVNVSGPGGAQPKVLVPRHYFCLHHGVHI